MESRKGSVALIFTVVFAVILLVLILGISSNWSPVAGDFLGILTFFNAVRQTFGEFTAFGNLVLWTIMFFAVEGVILYGYYTLARFIWVHIPQMQKWYSQSRRWFR